MFASVRHAARAVVLVPALVDRDLRRRTSRAAAPSSRTCRSRRRPDPRARSAGSSGPSRPGSRAPTGSCRRNRDHRALVVGDPVALVVVVELDARGRREVERDVRAVRLGVQAVVLVPGVVQRGLVLVAAGRERERPLPDVVARVVREVRRSRRPAPSRPGTAGFGLQRPDDGHGGRSRRVCRRRGNQQEPGRDREEQYLPHDLIVSHRSLERQNSPRASRLRRHAGRACLQLGSFAESG